MAKLDHSTSLDLTSCRTSDSTSVIDAYDLDPFTVEPLLPTCSARRCWREQICSIFRSCSGKATFGSALPHAGMGGERSLDVGVVAGAAPNSTIGLDVGATGGQVFTAYQSAIWHQEQDPAVIASSFGDSPSPSADSPFFAADDELFVDAALRGRSVVLMACDGGSGNQVGNGPTNVYTTLTSPFAVTMGGTSISTPKAAAADPTLDGIVQQANDHDLATLKMLVASGLDRLPENAGKTTALIQTVWNSHTLEKGEEMPDSYYTIDATSGGVDPTRPIPWYQAAFGLTPTTSDPQAETGRDVDAALGIPDGADQRGVRRPGSAAAGLHERPALWGRRPRARLVQRHPARQRYLQFRRWARHRLRLRGRPGP